MRLFERFVPVSFVVSLFFATALFAAEAADESVCAGAYYFHGWSGKTNESHLTKLLLNEYSDRQPVWGWTVDSVEKIGREIDYCADHGLKFWSFCWYLPGTDHTAALNEALDLYLKSPNRGRMKFCLLVANHGSMQITPQNWDDCSKIWLALFKQPTHLTVDGKPLLIIFSPHDLIQSFGGPEKVREAFDRLRADARAAGLPGVSFAACAGETPALLDKLQSCGYDVFTGYNYSFGWLNGGGEKPFQELIDKGEQTWNAIASASPLPYMPVATIGWDRRPWEIGVYPPEKMSVWYADRTPQKVEEFIRRGAKWINNHSDRATKEKLLIIYAWNELGEGGYLTPTKKDGTAYLEAVQKGLSDAKP